MNKSDIKWIVLALLVSWAILFGIAAGAKAEGLYPDNVEVFQIPSGQWCVLVDGNFGGCYCECPETGRICEATLPPTATDRPDVDPTPTPVPSVTPTVPTEEPTKQSCNRGIGNGSENCDPGNSPGQGQGAGRRAGEDRDE